MIRVFGASDRDFNTNGDIPLKPLKAKVHKEDNGDYYLEVETGLEYADFLISNNIIVTNTPQGAQAFRITNPIKTRKRVTIKAWHVSYDAENYLIADSYVVDKNCEDALNHLNSATEPRSPFKVISDIQTIDSFRCVRKSLQEAISTVIERWGGHLVRDNFTIGLRKDIGVDNGVTIQYKKNLKEISCEENWDNVVTKMLPTGTDGIMLNELDANASVYITSDIQYDVPYTKTISFEQNLNKEDFSDETAYKQALIDDLRTQAEAYIRKHCVPEVNYTLKANLEVLTDIGDIVEVKDERLGLDLTTSVISYDYDCILERYTEISFGNFKQKKLSNLQDNIVNNLSGSVASVVSNFEVMTQEVAKQTNAIWETMGESYIQYNGNSIVILDKLPKEQAKNVTIINNTGVNVSTTGINGIFYNVWKLGGAFGVRASNIIELFNSAGAQYGKIGIDGITINLNDKDKLVISTSGINFYSDGKNTCTLGTFKGRFKTLECESLTVGGKEVKSALNSLTGALEYKEGDSVYIKSLICASYSDADKTMFSVTLDKHIGDLTPIASILKVNGADVNINAITKSSDNIVTITVPPIGADTVLIDEINLSF